MTIRFTCPTCGSEHWVHEKHVGKEAVCKKCGTKMSIPFAVDEPGASPVLTPYSPPTAGEKRPRYRVMIVEDDEDLSAILRMSLEPSFDAMVANNGLEAWQMALDGEPDIIISDIMMPHMDGYEFIGRLRESEQFKSVPVVFLSALVSEKQIRRGYELGATLYVTKPVDPDVLRRKIETLIETLDVETGPKRLTIEQVRDLVALPSTGEAPPEPTPTKEPVAKEGAPEEKEATTGRDPAERVRILIVEGEPKSAAMLKTALEVRYEAVNAFHGLEAIEFAAKFDPDIFIISGILPKLSGYQLVPLLRKNRIFRTTPIVFLSEESRSRDRRHVEKMGIQRFVVKPFEIEEIAGMVREIVEEPGFEVHRHRVSDANVVATVARNVAVSQDSARAASAMEEQKGHPSLSHGKPRGQ